MSTELELAAAIERGRAILAERQRQEDERQRRQAREAEERRQNHLAKLPEWARPFASAGGNYEDYIRLDLPGCTQINFKSTSYHGCYDSASVCIPHCVEFSQDSWVVASESLFLDTGGAIDDIFAEAVAIAASHYDALSQMQADANTRNAMPADESPY